MAFELLDRFIDGHADRTELTLRFMAKKRRFSTAKKVDDSALEDALALLSVDQTAEQAVNGILKDPAWGSIGGRLEKLEVIPGNVLPCVSRTVLTLDVREGFWADLPPAFEDGTLRYSPIVVNLDT